MKKTILEQKTLGYKNYGLFSLSELPSGMGLTLGNSLKRILLTNIVGTAFTKIKYNNNLQNFTNIQDLSNSGIRENFFEIAFNIKKIILKSNLNKDGYAFLKIKGPKIVTASDIILPQYISIVNPNLYLFTLEHENTIELDLFFESGFNYKLSDETLTENTDNNWFILDSNFNPILKVNFNVKIKPSSQNPSVLKEILYFEIWTNGVLTANTALKEAFLILANFCIDALL